MPLYRSVSLIKKIPWSLMPFFLGWVKFYSLIWWHYPTLHSWPMRLFHPLDSMVVTRNLWLILLNKLLKHVQSCPYFFSSFSVCWVISNWFFFQNKSWKHICDQCCLLVAETVSWYPLIRRGQKFSLRQQSNEWNIAH